MTNNQQENHSMSKTSLSTGSERQKRYRAKIRTGERKRVQLVLDQEIGSKLEYLIEALQCNKVELFSRLIEEEWELQGKPIPEKK